MLSAEIIAIGSELLTPAKTDTNSLWLTEKLNDIGIEVMLKTTVKEMFATKPEKVIELAVRGMLPKTKLGKAMAKKLKVYADGEHRHTAQKPEAREI